MNYEMDDVCTIKDDVIDTRYNEFNNPCISLHYWSNQNKYGNYIHSGDESNSIKFYKNSGAKVLNDWKTIQIDKESIDNYLTEK